jgi:Mn2+/Fe2+ NRAMP family transporter
VVNAVVLPLHVVALQLLSSDGALMGEARSTSWVRAGGWISIALIVACVGALGWSQLP